MPDCMALTVSSPITLLGFCSATLGSLAAAACRASMDRVDAWRDHASLEAAVAPDDVELSSGAAVDNNQRPGIELERTECIDQTVRSDLRRLAGPHLDAQLGILTDDQRLR